MAAMTTGINPHELHASLLAVAQGFQQVLDSSAVPGGRSQADRTKAIALPSLASNFTVGCGMLAVLDQSRDAAAVARAIAAEANSTIGRWYDPKYAAAGTAMVSIVDGCGMFGGKRRRRGKKAKRPQHGGAMPDRYDVFTMIILGAVGASVYAGLSAYGMGMHSVVNGANYIVGKVVDYAMSLGLFKPQCDTITATGFNLLKQYTIGTVIPVETCLDKIRYNDAQMTAIKTSLSALAAVLGPITAYFTARSAGGALKDVYAMIKTRISIPCVDLISAGVSRASGAVCDLASRGKSATMGAIQRARRPLTADETPQETRQAAEVQATAEVDTVKQVADHIAEILKDKQLNEATINEVSDYLRGLAAQHGAPTSETSEQEEARTDGLSADSDADDAMKDAEGKEGGRRKKRITRRGKKGRKAKTVKKSRKGRSRKAAKAKKTKKTRRSRK